MTSPRLGGSVLAAAALFSVAFATPAFAQVPMSTLTLTLEVPEGGLSTVRLDCDPPGGSHPEPWTACDELATAGGDLAGLQDEPVACTMDFRPVTASARGVWDGEVVLWEQEFSNPCTLNAATGTVFAF